MSKKITALLLAVLMLAGIMAGCGKDEPAPAEKPAEQPAQTEEQQAPAQAGTRVLTDMLGREVEVPAEVNKIVPLGNAPRMISYLGLTDKVVGYSGMDPEKINPVCAYAFANKDVWASVPLVGTDAFGQTDYYPEEIIKAAPDVIVCTSPAEMADDLQKQTGIPVYCVTTGNVLTEDYDNCLRMLGEVCNASDRAEEVIKYVHDCLAELDSRTKDIPEDEKPGVLSAAATFKGAHGLEGVRTVDVVMDSVHADNLASGIVDQGRSVIVDMEQILAWNADYIFLDSSGVKLVQQDAKEHPDFYEKLKAFNEGHVYQYPSSTSYYQNMEITLANCYYVGTILYPEQFADINIQDKANEIIEFLLGAENYMSNLDDAGQGYMEVKLEGK